MSSSSPAPKLPIWIFLATDVVLLTAGAYIAAHAPRPLSDTTTLSIVACLIAGAIIGLVPLVAFYERQKNEALDDRQRALEALARTIETSAEQISIAAGGLHEIAEIAQRNLKHAEQLPQKLQEKMAEFQAQLANASDTEKEELEKEVEELRASEIDRLQTTFDRVAKTAAEFGKIEASIQRQLAATHDAATKLTAGSDAAVAKAKAAAEQGIARAGEQAAKAVSAAAAEATRELERMKTAVVRDLSAAFETNLTRVRETAQQLGTPPERLPAATPPVTPAAQVTASAAEHVVATAATPAPAADTSVAATPVAVEVASQAAHPSAAESTGTAAVQPAKRPRKPRRDEPAPLAPVVAAAGDSGEQSAVASHGYSPSATDKPAEVPAVAEHPSEPAAAPAASVERSATESSEPAAREQAPEPAANVSPHHNGALEPAAASPATANGTSEPGLAPKPARKRATPKRDDDQPALGLDLGDADQSPAAVVERVISSDGATRLIVTAYIGIGNRLFIRGNGPGLSWDKGVPLQFVSIGKWRWETNDANAPVEVKLFKNDVQESAGLGSLTIDPGHQHEVTANFS